MNDEQHIRVLLEQILASGCTPQEVCAQCPQLLPTVLQQLGKLRRVEGLLDVLFPASNPTQKDDRISQLQASSLPKIEGYEVLDILGRGGMGVVYRARHLKLNRLIALKMLLAGPFASPQEVARFVRESRAVAELQHPHIVQVHDVGDLEGCPFFTMEFVAGGSLSKKLAGAPQPARHAAELVAMLAAAVDFAHRKDVIHRDLKPANILLTNEGMPKIADFGLARHIDGDSDLTLTGARLGTPSYMAPEQALGRLGTVELAVDIYALGAILYEMLTGRPPFRAATAIETERQVINVEVAPPSRLNTNIPRNLETICLKCLHKDPARRYRTAADLAEDLQRFLEGKTVLARPVGWCERLWHWGMRNQAVAAALAGVVMLLGLIVTGSIWGTVHFHHLELEQRELAKEKGDLAERNGKLVAEKDRERVKAVLAERREFRLRQQAEEQGKELRRNLYLMEMNLAAQAASLPGGLGRVGERLARWEHELPDLRNWEWYYLNGLRHRDESTLFVHAQSVLQVAWSPQGDRLASASADGTICIWDRSGEHAQVRLRGHDRPVFSVAWNATGEQLASASWDGTARIWDAIRGTELFQMKGHTGEVYSVCWSPDGQTIASGGRDQTIQLWNAQDGKNRGKLVGHNATVCGLAWNPDSKRLASASHDSTVCLWDISTQERTHTLRGHGNWVHDVVWSPDGTQLASASNDQTVRIWDSMKGEVRHVLQGHTQGVTSVAWSPDGGRLVSGSDDQTLRIWSFASGLEAFSMRGHTAPVATVAWSPQGDRIASGGYEDAIKIWDPNAGPETPTLSDDEHPVAALAWCPHDLRRCASVDNSGVVKVWDVRAQKVLWTWREDKHFIHSLAWSPDGTRLATSSGNGSLHLWSVSSADSEIAVAKAHEGEVDAIAWSPDGKQLASAGVDKKIQLWNVTSHSCQLSHVIEKHDATVFAVAWSPDGRQIASACSDSTVRIWNAATGSEDRCYRGHTSQVVTVAWHPGGKMLASAGFDESVHLWNAATAQTMKLLSGHTTHTAQVIWNPDGTRLASAGRDGGVKVWDPETGKEALTLYSHASQVAAVAWSPDGMILVTAGEDHQIKIHDATAGYLAARSPALLPEIRLRLAGENARPSDWRSGIEILARSGQWQPAADMAHKYLSQKERPTWLMLDGLIAGPYSADMNELNPPETMDYFSNQTLKNNGPTNDVAPSIDWKTAPCGMQGIVDLGRLLDHRSRVSAYALFPVYSRDKQRIAILLGSDDQARLWLNGEQLYQSIHLRTAKPDEDAVQATLKPGWNSLLVRVANESGDHALCLRLSDSAADLARTGAK